MKLFDRREFQDGVLNLMLFNAEFMESYSHLIKAGYFKLNSHRALAMIALIFHKRYLRCIKKTEFLVEIEKFMRSDIAQRLEVTKLEITSLFDDIQAMDASDPVWYKEQLIPFAKHREARNIINKMSRELEEENAEINIETFQHMVNTYQDLDRDHSKIAMSFFENLDSLRDQVHKDVIETPWKSLNKCTGGIDVGELWSFLGKTNVGKSNILTAVGSHAIKKGFNVLHISFEDSQKKIFNRYASCISGVDRNHMEAIVETVIGKLKIASEEVGKLFIFKECSGSIKASQIRQFVQEVERKYRVVIDLVIIDYAQLLRPEPEDAGAGNEDWRTLEQSYRILRDTAQATHKRYLTAFQAAKAAETKALIGFGELGKSYGMAQVVDVAISLNQTNEEKAEKILRFHIVKLKDGDGVGNIWSVTTDHGKCEFLEVDAPEGSTQKTQFTPEDMDETI